VTADRRAGEFQAKLTMTPGQRRIAMHVHFPELSLAELLDDPLVQLLMARDGVKDAALRSLIQTIRYARRTRQDDDLNHAGKGDEGPPRRSISTACARRAIR
jgi:hypothetical protein